MGEVGEDFREWRKDSQSKRERNRKTSAEYLRKREIDFISKNGGAHLIVSTGVRGLKIDFWPGTGRFRARNGKCGYGVKNLVKYIYSIS